MERNLKGTFFILMGPSGCGKSASGNYIRDDLDISEIVSHTTRSKRTGEIEGKTYYFVDKETFDKVDKIELVQYGGNYYCTSRDELEKKMRLGKHAFIIAEINGVKQLIKNLNGNCVVIFIYAEPEIAELRMRERGDSEEQIQKRLKLAQETKEYYNFQYADYVIYNKDPDDFKKIARIVNGEIAPFSEHKRYGKQSFEFGVDELRARLTSDGAYVVDKNGKLLVLYKESVYEIEGDNNQSFLFKISQG